MQRQVRRGDEDERDELPPEVQRERHIDREAHENRGVVQQDAPHARLHAVHAGRAARLQLAFARTHVGGDAVCLGQVMAAALSSLRGTTVACM